jgi:hypothetical protein
MAFSTKIEGDKITIELNELLSIEFEGSLCYVYVADTWVYLPNDTHTTIHTTIGKSIDSIIDLIVYQKNADRLFSDLLILSRKVKQTKKRPEIRALNKAIDVAKLIYNTYFCNQTKQANGAN